MPRVPVLDRPQVATERSPRVPVQVDSGPARVLGAVAQGLGDLGQVRAKEMEHLDEIRVNTVEVQAQRVVDTVLYDPKDGALFQRGLNAPAASDKALATLKREFSALESGLSNDRQRLLAHARFQQAETDAQRRLMQHEGQEVRQADAASHDALQARFRETVAAEAVDLTRVNDTIRRADQELAKFGDRNGAAPEVIQQARAEAVSALRTQQIARLLDAGRVEQAKAVLAAHGADLTVDDRAKIEPAMEEATSRQGVARAATAILATTTTLTEANAQISELPVEQRKGVRQLVEAEYDAKEKARRLDEDADYLDAANLVDARPGAPARAVVPAAQWARLSVERRNALERRATAPDNDNQRWFTFYAMTPAERGKLTAADFQTKYWSHFDEAHRTRAESLYRESTTDRNGTGAQSAGIMTDNERVMGTLVGMHLVSRPQRTDWNDMDYRFASDFEQESDRRIRALEATKGGKATGTEKQDVITQLGWERSPVNVRRRGADEATRAEIREEGLTDRTYVPIDRIPPAEVERMKQAMLQNYVNPTNQRLEDAYAAFLMGLRNRYDTLLGRRVPPGSF